MGMFKERLDGSKNKLYVVVVGFVFIVNFK